MTTRNSIDSYMVAGAIALHSVIPDLLHWAERNEVNPSDLELQSVPRLGFRVGWSWGDDADDRRTVVLDICDISLVNSKADGIAETRARIQRFQLDKDEALALAHLILSVAR